MIDYANDIHRNLSALFQVSKGANVTCMSGCRLGLTHYKSTAILKATGKDRNTD